MKIHVLLGCALCLVLFVAESNAWFWPFGKSKDEKAKVDGKWSSWGPWSPCLQEETPPYRYKERTCTNPAPQNGGSTCKGVERKTSGCENCTRALGLENGKIKDGQISSPSFHSEFPARNARLNGDSGWCADIQDDEIYLQIDLEKLTTISAIATQGFYPDPQVVSLRRGRVSKYELMYSQDGLSWERYTTSSGGSELPGNRDKLGTVTNVLTPQINARFIRIFPLGFFSFMCMRVELYGCFVTCGGRLTENPGSLDARSSETEEKNCLWLIDLPNVRKIHFDFVNFDVPCANGEVEIRDGSAPYEDASVLGRYCGLDVTPPQVVGSKGKLWVHFTSNSSDPHVGFYANYFPGCGGQLRVDEGMFETPNYPNNYFQNSKCTWTITVSKGKVIQLRFPQFDVDGDIERHRCPSDHVTIWDGVNLGAPLIGRFCNSNLPPPLICSSNNTLKLKFRADEVIARTGFLGQFHAVKANVACFPSSSIPTMSLTPSFLTPTLTTTLENQPTLASSYGIILPSTSANFRITKTTAYTATPSSFAVLPAFIHPNRTQKPKPLQTLSVIPNFGNVSTNLSTNENPDLMARKKADEEEDDKDDLITIIIISCFGFVVLCLIIASIVPGIKRHCEKEDKDKENSSIHNSGLPQCDEIFAGSFQEAEESSMFLPVKADSYVFLSQGSTEELPPEYDTDSVTCEAEEPKTDLPEDLSASVQSEINDVVPLQSQEVQPQEVKDTPEETDFHMSCQDLSRSFALEMQAMMSKFIEDTDDGLEATNAQNPSPPNNLANSMQGSESQHESTAGEQYQLPETKQQETPDAAISNMSPAVSDDHGCMKGHSKPPESCITPYTDLPTPWHVQPDRSLGRTRGMKPKGTSASSYAESKDSGCASSLENLHDTETCV